MIGDEEAAEARFLLKPLQNKGEERSLAMADWQMVIDILACDESDITIATQFDQQ